MEMDREDRGEHQEAPESAGSGRVESFSSVLGFFLWILVFLLARSADAGAAATTARTLRDCLESPLENVESMPLLEGIWSEDIPRVRERVAEEVERTAIYEPGSYGDELFGPQFYEIFQVGRLVFLARWQAPIEISLAGVGRSFVMHAFCMDGKRIEELDFEGSRLSGEKCVGLVESAGALALLCSREGPDGVEAVRRRFSLGRVLPFEDVAAKMERSWHRRVSSHVASSAEAAGLPITMRSCAAHEGVADDLSGTWINLCASWDNGVARVVQEGHLVITAGNLPHAFGGRSLTLGVSCIRGNRRQDVIEDDMPRLILDEPCSRYGWLIGEDEVDAVRGKMRFGALTSIDMTEDCRVLGLGKEVPWSHFHPNETCVPKYRRLDLEGDIFRASVGFSPQELCCVTRVDGLFDAACWTWRYLGVWPLDATSRE
jgi:hypothetical protein